MVIGDLPLSPETASLPKQDMASNPEALKPFHDANYPPLEGRLQYR
jgi:hypothetical protein